MSRKASSPLFIIFTTVLVDLIGFGMVIPLIGLYGRHYGADGMHLSILGGIYSLMQFIFAPLWGTLSDRIGRRPVLLVSLLGSTLSYLAFGLAPNYTWLLIARGLGGIFAANISTAQAYVADVTTPKDRAKGMGMIGAAFGIGFTLGPPLGGITAAKIGIAAPGLIASAICGLNFLLAIFRLPESFPPENRKRHEREFKEGGKSRPFQIREALKKPGLGLFLLTFFLTTFAFSTMEQTFSLLFQVKFNLNTGDAGLDTGLVLMVAGLLGAVIQGGLIRKLIPKFGELRVLKAGFIFNVIAMLAFPYLPTYGLYFFLTVPLALGFGLINPSISSLISRSVSANQQGSTLGVSQGLGSLARALGPFCGLLTFEIRPDIPYLISAGIIVSLLLLYWIKAPEIPHIAPPLEPLIVDSP